MNLLLSVAAAAPRGRGLATLEQAHCGLGRVPRLQCGPAVRAEPSIVSLWKKVQVDEDVPVSYRIL